MRSSALMPLSTSRPAGLNSQPWRCLIASGEKTGAGRAAHRMGDVTLGEANAGCGQAVDIRRVDDLAAVDAGVADAEIVCEDQDDIGWSVGILVAAGGGVVGRWAGGASVLAAESPVMVVRIWRLLMRSSVEYIV